MWKIVIYLPDGKKQMVKESRNVKIKTFVSTSEAPSVHIEVDGNLRRQFVGMPYQMEFFE